MNVRLDGGTTLEVAPGTPLLSLAPPTAAGLGPVVGATLNFKVCGLGRTVEDDCRVAWLPAGTRPGIRFIRRSLSFVLVKAAHDLFPESRLVILHSLSKGSFCELRSKDEEAGGDHHLGGVGALKPHDVERLQARVRELVDANLEFVRHTLPRDEAIERLHKQGRSDLVRLFRGRPDATFELYELGGYLDFFHGDLVPHTGYLQHFELRYYPPGFILRFPEDKDPEVLPPYVETARLSKVFYEFKRWSQVLEVPDVGALNEVVSGGEINDFIRVAEALQEKRMGQIADAIDAARERIRMVLIAGPSASGKTTFAQRLSVQLRVVGLRPIPISLDDFYVNRVETPLDEHGEYDYECVEALDLNLLNDVLQRLTWGEAVQMPRYNFKTGLREWRPKPLQLGRGDLLVLEGIHALNPRLTVSIPRASKYQVYISALTQLNLDDHNRVPTTDTRLIRRMARDIQFRGIGAQETLQRWRSVRRGEEKYIFPFQEESDVMFNSGLFYELGVLKGLVWPLLEAVPEGTEERIEAQRLMQLLENFQIIGTDEIPPNSILREFIGATCFFRTE
jgi:uridine kinase